jgi:vitamin B12 transporter
MKPSSEALPLRACARLTLAAMAISFSTSVQADSENLDTLTVTANRMPTNNALAPNTVITRADIDRLQINDLPSLLSRFPGIDMTMTGGLGKSSSIFMRGTESDHVLFLVDGVKWFSATSGGSAIEHFPVSQIERIEIVRGPRSGVYGAEAIGGVIQIFTRKGGNGLKPYFSAGVGSKDTREATVGVSGGDQTTSFNVSVSHLTTNGINAREGSNPDDDGYRNNSVSARVQHQLTENWSLGANFMRAEADNEYDGSGLTSISTNDSVQQVLGLHNDWQLTEDWLLKLSLSESRDQYEDFTDNSSTGVFDTRHRLVSISNILDVAAGHRLNLGFDYEHDKVLSSVEYDEKSRDNRATYISWQAEVADFSWLLSARHDNNEAYGNETTGTADVGYFLTDTLQIVANAGTAFKAPSYNVLYYPGFGSPDIKPEKSKTYGLGLVGFQDWGKWSVHTYETEIRDLISGFPAENVDEAEIQGVEFDVATSLVGWQVNFNATFLNPEDKETDKTLRRRAQRMANLHLDRQWGKWTTGASWKLVGHRYDDADNEDRIGGYGLVDLRLGYRIDPDWTLKVTAQNLLDKEYKTALAFGGADYNMLDRTVMFSIHYQP